ncbi:hypothetical protein [Streptomyces atroolivaceus]
MPQQQPRQTVTVGRAARAIRDDIRVRVEQLAVDLRPAPDQPGK